MTRGRPEVTCGAGTRSGGQCGRAAGHGTTHPGYGTCKLHGGSTPTHVRAAQLELVEMERARIAEQYALGPGVDVLSALQEALNASHAVMRFWQERVRELELLTERRVGGSTDVAAVVRAEERARRDLARVATDCVRLGLDARRAALDEQDRRLVIEVLNGAVRKLGADPQQPDVHDAILAAVDDAVAVAEADVRAAER